MNCFSKDCLTKQIFQTLLLIITTAKLLLLENSTDKITSSKYCKKHS